MKILQIAISVWSFENWLSNNAEVQEGRFHHIIAINLPTNSFCGTAEYLLLKILTPVGTAHQLWLYKLSFVCVIVFQTF